jgi:HAD superfamily phosphatase (TIGR01668 family)
MSLPAKSRALLPDFCFTRVEDITTDWLATLGILGLLLDVDNTITRWELLEVPEPAMQWLAGLAAAGIQVRLLSNGLAHKRQSVARQTGVAEVGGPLFKPLPGFYRRGLSQMGLPPAKVLMVGDSVFTDIAGANRCGIWTALVDPLGHIDFVGTKLYRALEASLRLRRPHTRAGDLRKAGIPTSEAGK